MKHYTALICIFLLAGCNALGGVAPDLATAAQNASAGCYRVESLVLGKGVMTFANDTKGAIKNGSITINPADCSMAITNAPAVAPTTTTTTGSSTVTTVTKPQ